MSNETITTDHDLIKKLLLRPEQQVLIVNAPMSYMYRLGEAMLITQMPENAEMQFDFVQVFVYNQADVYRLVMKSLKACKANGIFWVCYPKKTGSIATDISRDQGWETLEQAGYLGVTLISIDETWSALRFKHSGSIKSITRNITGGASQQSLTVPADLQQLLQQNPEAQAMFDKLPYTHRREYIQWIEESKKDETRQKRLLQTIELLLKGKK